MSLFPHLLNGEAVYYNGQECGIWDQGDRGQMYIHSMSLENHLTHLSFNILIYRVRMIIIVQIVVLHAIIYIECVA